MNFRNIKRLNEADDIQPMMPAQPVQPMAAPQAPDQMPPAPVATSMEEVPTFQEYQEEPQAALPQPDVMNLTVQELLDRCDNINPLICMGLRQFIDTNRDQLLSMTTGEITVGDTDQEQDLNFSKAVEPQQPEFSLDQPEAELEFPQA
jgi:type IV secretory pathway VirB10-like protein